MLKKALNFDWTFKTPFVESDLETLKGEAINLPHQAVETPLHYFDETITQGIHSYQKIFTLETLPQRLFIRFEGVMSKADIYLNQTWLTQHVGGYTSFNVELTEVMQQGENTLFVKVDSRENGDHPPFGHVIDYLTYGGIYREVSLIETNDAFIEHVFIDGDAENLHVRIAVDTVSKAAKSINFTVYDEDKEVLTHTQTTSLQEIIKVTLPHQLALWSIDHPKLYKAIVRIDGTLAYETSFGIRTIRVTDKAFYLNDEPIFLRGLNRHQSYPYAGYAMPKRAQIEDADILKYTLGCTIVRSSHYPPSKHFLDRCDEIGLLVFTELPGWQHIGDDAWKSHALADLESLVKDGYNHPSIVVIGTRINESKDDDVFYTATRDLVKAIDSTRPTGGVRFFGKSQLLEDIYTLNDFVHKGDNIGLSKKTTMTNKHHPYLITEFNGHMFPTKAFDHEQRRIDHALRHFNVLDAAYGMDGVMGAIGWCMNDYNTHKDFGSGDHICHHGVLDIGRNDKYAASVYASQGTLPSMDVLSMMMIGDREGGQLKEVVVATNVDDIDLYRNDIFIGTFKADRQRYKHLPHPPIIIDDFIGDRIKHEEAFTEKDADTIKQILLKTLKNDLKMSWRTKLSLGRLMFKYKLRYEDAVHLYTRYIGGWGDTVTHYRFEGKINGKTVKVIHKGHNDDYQLTAHYSKEPLIIADTYDVAKIVIELSNAFEQRAYYTSEVIEIKTSEHLQLIGPSHRSMQGGIQSIWVKTQKVGNATISVTSPTRNPLTIAFTIKKM